MNGVPPIRFAAARGGRIAYQDFGEGDVTIVAIPPAAQNIEAGWEQPLVADMLNWFGSFARYIHFDKLGTGASDRNRLVPGIDERVDDLRAVMDAAGVEQAHLFAQSEGGPTTLLFAATYPHRVQSITLIGSAARMAPDEFDRDQSMAMRRTFADAWGTPDSMAIDLFAPSMTHNQEFRDWHQRYERLAASADSLYELLVQMIDMDVREVLPEIDLPVLVMHNQGDPSMPIEFSRELVDLLPNARFVELEGIDHFCYLGDTSVWMRELSTFVTGTAKGAPVIAPEQIEITTLGRFTVSVRGEEVPISAWGSKRARLLLKRLIVARGWPVTREELIDVLWPDETDMGRLGARLSVQLSAVRRILGGGVTADRETVALDLDHVSLDVERLLRSKDDAEIVGLHRGEFLAEERYEDWTHALRTEAQVAFTSAARRRIDELRDRGHLQEATSIAQRLVEADIYDDDAYEMLAGLLEEGGDRSGASRVRRQRDEALRELLDG